MKFDTADVFGAIDDGDQSKKEVGVALICSHEHDFSPLQLRSQELAGWADKKGDTMFRGPIYRF